jgi:prepilin-type N-terminal cleavage/methylation domain-containing protein
MNNSQKGFSVLEVILVLIVVGLIGAAGFYLRSTHHKAEEPNNHQTTSVPEKTLFAELKTTKTESSNYSWDLYLNTDGSGKTTYTPSSDGLRPTPEDKTFPSKTFDISSFKQVLNSLDLSSYTPDCNQPSAYSLFYSGKTLNDVECYVTKTRGAFVLGNQISHILDKAQL